MTKKELTKIVADKLDDFTQKDVGIVIDAVFNVITEEVIKGEKVTLSGFGAFEPGVRAARKGRNPKTGEVMTFDEKRVCKFKPAKALKNAVAAQ